MARKNIILSEDAVAKAEEIMNHEHRTTFSNVIEVLILREHAKLYPNGAAPSPDFRRITQHPTEVAA